MLKLSPFKEIGNKVKIYKLFGGKDKYKEAIKEFEYELYNIAQ
jgi:hypothetical protein